MKIPPHYLSILLLTVGALVADGQASSTAVADSIKALDARVWDIPLMSNVVIDGEVSDWHGQGFALPLLAADSEKLPPSSDFTVSVWMGWDAAGLLYRVEATDDFFVESDNPGALFENDSVEVFLLSHRHTRDAFQLTLSPGLDPRFGQMRAYVWDYRSDEALKERQPARYDAAVRTRNHSYSAEIRLPWAMLEIQPRAGLTVAGKVFVNDVDPGRNRIRYTWKTAGFEWGGLHIHTLRLAEAGQASPSPAIAPWGGYDLNSFTYVHFFAQPNLVGQTIKARWENEPQGAEAILRADGPRTSASLQLKLPVLSRPVPPIELTLDGAPLTPLFLPDRRVEIKEMLFDLIHWPQWMPPTIRARWSFLEGSFDRHVFAGDSFPAFGFPDPEQTVKMAGPFAIDIHWYDQSQRLTSRPTSPGRYGAVIQMRFQEIGDFTFFRTLYRKPGENPAMAGLAESDAIDLAGENRGPLLTAAGENERWWHQLRTKLGTQIVYPHLVFLPKAATDDPEKRWPLLIFLHGSGGGLSSDIFWQSCADFLRRGPGQPPEKMIVAFLRNRENLPYEAPAVIEAIQTIMGTHPVDAKRVYLTGFSLGGFGTWDAALYRPDLFAAIAPIGGGRGDPTQAARLKDLPIWVFNGQNDPSTTVEEARPMVEALEKVNPRVQFTIFPGAQHPQSLELASSYAPLYEWFLAQMKKENSDL